jgi:hypothetical protein
LAPTQQEIRRAIYWADRWLSGAYREFKVGTETHGLWFDMGIPISTLNETRGEAINPGFCWHGGFAEIINCVELIERYLGIWFWYGYWLCSVKIEPVETDYERWHGKYYFGNYLPVLPEGEYPVGEDDVYAPQLDVIYEPDPANPKRMKLTITVEKYEPKLFPNDKVSLWFAGQKVWDNIKNAVGQTKIFTTPEYGRFSGNLYDVMDYNAKAFPHFYYNSIVNRKKGEMIKKFLDKYGYTVSAAYPQFRLSDGYTDDFWCDWALMHDCDLWGETNFPRVFPYGIDHFPTWEWSCYSRLECVTGKVCGLAARMWHVVANRAIHLMNKYKDPTRKEHLHVDLGCGPTMVGDVYNSAEDYLLKGYDVLYPNKDITLTHPLPTLDVLHRDPLKALYSSGKGMWCEDTDEKKLYLPPVVVLSAMAELGYGFGYEEAKAIADDMAELILKIQWGYQTGFTEPKGKIMLPDGTIKVVNRPDVMGGFFHQYQIDEEGDFLPPKIGEKVQMFKEIPCPTPSAQWGGYCCNVSEEFTWTLVRDLRVYEYYKYRLKV